MSNVTIYCDGACSSNPGNGGWAAIVNIGGKETVLSGYVKNTTNNRMEIQSAIEGLEFTFNTAASKNLSNPTFVKMFTDSEYLRKGITEWLPNWKHKGWRTSSRRLVENRDLWERLDTIVEKLRVSWYRVQGHSGDLSNERCDTIAKLASKQFS